MNHLSRKALIKVIHNTVTEKALESNYITISCLINKAVDKINNFSYITFNTMKVRGLDMLLLIIPWIIIFI